MRLPLALLRVLLQWVCRSLRDITSDVHLFHGHRVFHVDGSPYSRANRTNAVAGSRAFE